MTIQGKILAIRDSKRIKQSEMAKRLNTECSNYSRLEKRNMKLTIEQLMLIANALDVTIFDLLQDEPATQPPAVPTNEYMENKRVALLCAVQYQSTFSIRIFEESDIFLAYLNNQDNDNTKT